MNINKMIKVFIVTSLIVLLFGPIFSQENQQPGQYVKAIINYAAWWWLFFIIGIFVIIIGIALRSLSWSKYIVYSGLLVVFVSIFLCEFLYVLPLIPQIKVTGLEVDPAPCTQPEGLSFLEQVACIFSGLTPKGGVLAIVVWFVFLFTLPLAIIVGLFWEFTSSFIITNRNVRRVIAFAAGLIAYRFLMAYLFVEFISVGLGGIALFFINILFFGWAVNGIRRLFASAEMVKKMREVQDLAQLERLMRMRDELYAAWEAAVRAGNTQKADELKKQIDNIDEQINQLSNKTRPAPS